jgi:uncharacterized protein (TIGR03435 family)
MLRSLLAERFELRLHIEDREVPIYALVLGRSDGQFGPNVKRSNLDCAAISAAQTQGRAMPAMTPPSNGAPLCGMTQGGTTVRGGGVSLEFLADSLSGPAGRTVVDRTGLTGLWEFTLIRAPQQPGAGTAPLPDAPSVFTAVQEQLGLRLEPSRGTVQVLVVDHIERPTEN